MCKRSLEDIDWFNIAKLRSRESKHQAEIRTVQNKIKKSTCGKELKEN